MSKSPSPGDPASHQVGARDTEFGGLASEILEIAGDAFYALDADWRVVYINRPAAEMLGAPRESVVGRVLWERFPRLPDSEAGRRLREAVSRNEAVEFEALSPTTGRWVWAQVVPLSGGLYGVFWRDMTARRQQEEALRRSNERLHLAMDAAHFGAWEFDIETGDRDWSEPAKRVMGISAGTEPSYEALIAAAHPEDRDRVAAAYRRSYDPATGGIYQVEYRVIDPNGGERWVSARGRTLFNGAGKPVRMVGVTLDITAERQREQALRDAQNALRQSHDELERRVAVRTRDLAETNARLRVSEEQQRRLFARAPVPMHALDKSRQIVDVNEAWLRLFAYAPQEVIGRPITDFHAPGQPAALHDARWQEVLQRGELRNLERRFVKKSGEEFDALISVQLERDQDGAFLRTISTTLDITARKRAEAAARREQQLSQFLIDSSIDGIIGLDRDFRYVTWNPSMEVISGVGRDQVMGRSVFELRPEIAGTPIERAWRAAMAGQHGSVRDVPFNYPAPGRRSGFCDIHFAPLYGPDHTIVGAFAFMRDITEQRQIEEQLRQAQKMEAVGQLTGGVAHDFNNLLTVIIGNIENLQRFLPQREEPRRMAAAIVRASTRAATLTHRLLAFARRQPLEPRAIEVNKLVAGMSELLRRLLGETIVVETVLASALWRTHADPNQLENALLNLAVNARDAMPSGGKLTIETANAILDDAYAAQHQDVSPGQYVMIAISDTGSGMSEATVEKAFEPFFTTKEVGQGTGLGLPQVYGFVKQSGGHVKIYSELGHGTTVKLYLPRLAAGEVVGEATIAAKPVPAARANDAILLVEDDEDVRHFSADILREVGYRVVEAADGLAGLKALADNPGIRLLFTDVGLPGGLNGRQLADEARRRWPDLKVLFTTGYARNAIVHQGRLDPGVALLPKPFTAATLAAVVSQVLRGDGGGAQSPKPPAEGS